MDVGCLRCSVNSCYVTDLNKEVWIHKQDSEAEQLNAKGSLLDQSSKQGSAKENKAEREQVYDTKSRLWSGMGNQKIGTKAETLILNGTLNNLTTNWGTVAQYKCMVRDNGMGKSLG